MSPEQIKQIIKDKVEGVWEECHDATGHRYRNTITKVVVRSVTTKISSVISKPHLIKWAVKMGIEWLCIDDRLDRLKNKIWRDELISGAQLAYTDIRDNAGGIGTQAHKAIERYINEWDALGVIPKDIRRFTKPTDSSSAIASMRAAEKWFRSQDIIPIATEILVGNDKYSAGQLDFLCLLNGELTLIDHKTSNSIDKEGYSMQIATYKYFFEEMTGLIIKKSKILHLSKDYDKFSIWLVKNMPSAYKAFKSVCFLYDWKYNNKKDKVIKDIKRLKI